MKDFTADFFDGRVSARQAVSVSVDEGVVRVVGDSLAFDVPLRALAVTSLAGSAPPRFRLPDGGLLVAHDAARAREAIPMPPLAGLAHRLERHRNVVAAAVLGIAFAGYVLYQWVIPKVALEVSRKVPVSAERKLGNAVFTQLEAGLKESKAPIERFQRIHERFGKFAYEAGLKHARLEIRDAPWLGANAITLPGGEIVLTDQLIEAIVDNDVVLAVLAHELGHVQHRHAVRLILQASATSLFTMALYGDVGAISGLAAAAPTILLQTGYSRDLEREADEYAHALLVKQGLSPKLLATALSQLEEAKRAGERSRFGYLETHPATRTRVDAAHDAARAAAERNGR